MIYKFRSKASGDVIMLAPTGDRVLAAIGRQPAPKGIFEVDDMPAIIAAIESAIVADDAARAARRSDGDDGGTPVGPDGGISLRQRAWPLIEMLQRCHAAREPVVWGV